MKGFLFVPDISGFTHFVRQTELEHSRHIIAELLEVVLRTNTLGLKVSEVEGDAVLFYRAGSPPLVGALIEQVTSTFVAFHTQLKGLERDRVCQCGACSTASRLTLKFIAHAGALQETSIGGFTKLIGADVILVHALLKNSLPHREYFLATDEYLGSEEVPLPTQWGMLAAHTETVQEFGAVPCHVAVLSGLHATVPEPPTNPQADDATGGFRTTVVIDAPREFVFAILTDNSQKTSYVKGLREVRQESPINRVHTAHTCVFDNLEIRFQTEHAGATQEALRYVERVSMPGNVELILDYALAQAGPSTQVSLRISARAGGRSARTRLKTAIVLLGARISSGRRLSALKAYVENRHRVEQAVLPVGIACAHA